MPSLLFERDVDFIVSDLQEDGTVTVRHQKNELDAQAIFEETKLTYTEFYRLYKWLDEQIDRARELDLHKPKTIKT